MKIICTLWALLCLTPLYSQLPNITLTNPDRSGNTREDQINVARTGNCIISSVSFTVNNYTYTGANPGTPQIEQITYTPANGTNNKTSAAILLEFNSRVTTITGTLTYNYTNCTSGSVTLQWVTGSSSFTQLPIELLDFKAQLNNKVVTLLWKTAEEKNVDYFVIERSKNGISFEEIAKIKTGAISKEYSFIDEKPNTGVSYYRLGMPENDLSKITHSTVLSVVLSANGKIKLAPTLATNNITIDLPEDFRETNLSIMNVEGVIIKSIQTKAIQETIDVSDLASGFYFVVIQNGLDKYTEKFVKK